MATFKKEVVQLSDIHVNFCQPGCTGPRSRSNNTSKGMIHYDAFELKKHVSVGRSVK